MKTVTFDQAILLDAHRLFAESFALLLEEIGVFNQIRIYHDLENFRANLSDPSYASAVVFVEYYLKDSNGLSVAAEIKRHHRHAKIVFLTSGTSPVVMHNILVTKPHAILSKQSKPEDLRKLVENLSNKTIYLDRHIRSFLLTYTPELPTFTPRELELLHFFEEGKSNKETAAVMNLSVHTVVSHRKKMMQKAGVTSIGQLINLAKSLQII